MAEEPVFNNLPCGRQHPENDGGDQPDPALDRAGLALQGFHLAFVILE